MEIADLFKLLSAQRKPRLRMPGILKAMLIWMEFKHSSFGNWKNSVELPQGTFVFYFWGSRLIVGFTLFLLFCFPSFFASHLCRFLSLVHYKEVRRVLKLHRCQNQILLSILVFELMICLFPENISSEISLNMFILYLSSWRISWQGS